MSFNCLQLIRTFILGLCQMVLITSKTSLQKWSEVFLFPSVSPVFFQIGTVTYQHRLRFRRVSIVMSTATGQSRGARDRDKVWNRALSPRAPGLLERQQASLPSESTWAERAARWNPVRSQRVRALRINGGCHATLDGNKGGNDRFSCVGIVSFYSIAKIFCEYKKWCWKIIVNTI